MANQGTFLVNVHCHYDRYSRLFHTWKHFMELKMEILLPHTKKIVYMNKNPSKELSAFWKKNMHSSCFFFFFSDLAFGFLRDVWSLYPISWEFGPGFFFLVRPCHPCHLHRNEAKDTRGSWVCGRLSRSTLYLRFFTRIPQLICPEPWRVLVCLYKNQDFGNRKKCIYFLHMSIYLIKKSI